MVRLSPQHGLNPSLMQCFYCGKEYGVAIPGMLRGDAPAPRSAVWSREPCDECAEHMKAGVILVSVRDSDVDSDNPYRTGGFAVVTDEAIRQMVQPADLAESILKARFCFVPDSVWQSTGLAAACEAMAGASAGES